MSLRNNTLLQGGKYKIIRFINSGGFGCTYEAEHTLFKTHVAIKEFFKDDLCNRDERTNKVSVGVRSKAETVAKLKKKFLEEATSVFQMKHPGIVRVIDIFEENGTAYYVMDFIDGCSLSDLVKRRGKLPEKEALHYILQVVEALQYVHARNRLHLDIKPGNIMVDKHGRAILIDFGASKHYNENSGKQDSTLLGINTPGYTPVEQAARNFSKFNPATDIYALGATLYTLLTGIPPTASILRADEDDENEIFNYLPSSVSTSTKKALEAAMQIRSINRPQNLEEFKKMLGADIANQEKTVYDDLEEKVEDTVVNVEEAATNKKRKTVSVKQHKTVSNRIKKKEENINEDTEYIPVRRKTITPCIVPSGTINGHEYVDLGLSVKWATCNVGANTPSDYGDYFSWGETSPKSKYTEENSTTYNKIMSDTPVDIPIVRKKWWQSIFGESKIDISKIDQRNISGDSRYDVARAKWGGTWRLPTVEEIDELVNICEHRWTTYSGHKGYIIIGPNGNSIFLTAAGCRYGSSLGSVGKYGHYWSSSPYESDTQFAYGLHFSSVNFGRLWFRRYIGRTVRPVSE